MNDKGTCETCGKDGDLTVLDGKKLCPICFIYQVHGMKPVDVVNPNCSEIVFAIPGMTRERAVSTLRGVGILDVKIPLGIISGKHHDDATWDVLADRDNQLVPNMDSEYGCAQLDIIELETGMVEIHGGINLEYSAFPTLKKIQDAFPGRSWEEVTGGSTTVEFEEWVKNGMVFTNRQKKAIKFDRKKPGKDTRTIRKKFLDPLFAKECPGIPPVPGKQCNDDKKKREASGKASW
jgi:hypothetical protein